MTAEVGHVGGFWSNGILTHIQLGSTIFNPRFGVISFSGARNRGFGPFSFEEIDLRVPHPKTNPCLAGHLFGGLGTRR